jgi:hypothetical protein
MNEFQVIQPDDRSEIVLNKLSEISKRVVDDFCEMAELLHEAWENEYHKLRGYNSFQDYTEIELDIKGGKAYFLVRITKKLKQLGIPWQDVKEVGWRKTAAIEPILTRDNAKKWIEEAKGTPLTHLSEKVKAEKQGRQASEDPPIKMTIQLDQDENTIVNAAIDYAKKYEEAKTTSKAIVQICYQYFQSKE